MLEALRSFDFWTGWGAVGVTALGGFMVVIGTLLSALGQAVQQKEITDLSRENSRLSKQTLTSVVGSPEGYYVVFPELSPTNPKTNGQDTAGFSINNISDFPMIDSSVMIFNTSDYILGTDGGIIHGQHIGDVYERTPGPRLKLFAPVRKDADNVFSIIIRSRAGAWEEKVVITWTGEKYEADYSMTRMDEARETIKYISDDFPFIKPPKIIFPENWKKAEIPEEWTPEAKAKAAKHKART